MLEIEIYLQHKNELQKKLVDLLARQIDASVETEGPYRNEIRKTERLLREADEKVAKLSKETIFKDEIIVAPGAIKTIKIFLASSSELKTERDQFEIFINRENNELINKNVFLRLVVWEDFIDAISETRLQDEYNKSIQQSDIFLSLFYTKAGKYTEEEFDAALTNFKKEGKPLVYTYFKNVPAGTQKLSEETSLLNFKKRLSQIGHYLTSFENIYDLKYQFKMQLEKIIPQFI